ncbi:glucuronoxylan 4-O-methyltransferase 3-like [Olea europaea subsp. europaea]|uniref:Glucuronoxylan 4-O-methyltransferase 3-like n=1 Tax=Olea europaea subsp. europaea TaxID=158383 RepID=A0A8S0QN84_OLEEU|nr:glucuronoxylan 4-O-methyltransferase 3-like [Olea europaea subsp. europaea]
MKSKNQPSLINLKLMVLSFFFLLVLYVILRSNYSSFQPIRRSSYPSFLSICNKIPPSLATSLVHYATTNVTPQQDLYELSRTLRVLEKKSPCNFLVFGLGFDSLLWASLNHRGRTVFLEDDKNWMKMVKKQMPSLEIYHVSYETDIKQADELLYKGKSGECKVVGDPRSSKCPLAIKNFPSIVYEIEWDVIMVDAPVGSYNRGPGRMNTIYTVGLLAKNKEDGETDVFVHDIERKVEDTFSRAFLCDAYITEEIGRLRHFNIPSHRTIASSHTPFCP